MIKFTYYFTLFCLVMTACAQSQNASQDNILLNSDEFLLAENPFLFQSFSINVPKGWVKVSEVDSLSAIYLDPIDSSMMLVNVPQPNLSAFGEPQNSVFRYNGVSFVQNVYQNERMVFFSIAFSLERDSSHVYYAIPRQVAEDKAHLVEASLGSIKSVKTE